MKVINKRKIESRVEKAKNFVSARRKFLAYTAIDNAYRKEMKLSVKQYEVLDDIYRKQSLPQRVKTNRAGWCWAERKNIAEVFHVSVDFIDKLVKRRPDLLEVDKKSGYMRVVDWQPNIEMAMVNGSLSRVHQGIGQLLKISDEAQCVMNFIANYIPDRVTEKSCRLSDEQIADRLFLSARTVFNCLKELEHKKIIELIADRKQKKQRVISLTLHAKHQIDYKEYLQDFLVRAGKESTVERKSRERLVDMFEQNNIPVDPKLRRPGGTKERFHMSQLAPE